jgi:hypothetical protein
MIYNKAECSGNHIFSWDYLVWCLINQFCEGVPRVRVQDFLKINTYFCIFTCWYKWKYASTENLTIDRFHRYTFPQNLSYMTAPSQQLISAPL